MSGVEVRVLGPPSLRVEGEERPLPRKAFALLSVLCLGGTQTREALAALAHCRRAYEAAWPSGNVAVTFWTLPVYARALAAGGQPTRAAEVVGLLLHHPASGRWTREQAQVLLREWRPPMPGMERALNRGAGRTVPELFGQRLA